MEREYKQYQVMNDGFEGPGETAPPMTPGDFFNIARRRKWSLILPFFLVAAIALSLALLLPPKYRSTATILIEEQEIPTDFVTATVTSFAEQRLLQINQRIMSTTKLLEIIDRFDIYKRMRARKTTEEVIAQMRSDVHLQPISSQTKNRGGSTTIAFTLSYEGKDHPDTIQKVANVLVSLYLQENLEVRARQTAETSQFLEEEVQRVRSELARVETALSDFKEQHMNQLPELLQTNIQGLNSSERNIESLVEQLRMSREREGYLHTQLASLSPFLENSDRSRLQLLETELVSMMTRFSDNHPDVIKAKAEVEALKTKLAMDSSQRNAEPDEPDNPAYVTLAAQLASTQSEIRSIQHQIAENRKTKAMYEARVEKTPRVERAYRELVSEQGNIRLKYNDLMQKYQEAKVAHGLEEGQKGERFTLIDPPRLPEKPFKPNRAAIMLIGAVLGIGAGVGWAALREFSDQSVRGVDRLTLSTGFPVLGHVPNILTRKDRRRIMIRRLTSVSTAVLVVVAGITVFHFFVMDLNVFWAKLGRKMVMP